MEINDVLIRANDSIYVFSEVTIDPNQAINELGQASHLIEQDSIIFNYKVYLTTIVFIKL